MSKAVESVVAHFHKVVSEEGGAVEIVAVEGSTLRLRYTPGSSDCEACVMLPDDLRDLIAEALQRQDPTIAKVELVAAA